MLLQFGVENHRSMRGRQSLSLIASALRDQVDGLIKCSAAPNEKILPSVVIYGANASGKSNLVSAISFMRSAVLHSHRRGDPGGKIARRPFSLDPKCEKEPTVFDVDFIVDQIRYHYGFEFTDDEILTEWLFSFPSNRRQLLFERARGKYKFGRSLKGQNRVISNLTRENSLFLSAAFQNGHEQLSKVAEFFRSIESNTNISVEDSVAAMRFLDHEVDTRVIDFFDQTRNWCC